MDSEAACVVSPLRNWLLAFNITSPYTVCRMSTLLKKELETYESHKNELVAVGEGKYALIQGDRICGVWDTYDDALKSGYKEFGVTTPFLVKKISGMEFVHHFTRDLTTCQH